MHVVEVEHVALDRFERRSDLLAADFVAAAVDRVEQALRQVGARAEELHLLADDHRRHAAGDRPVVAPRAAHDLVAFELERARVDGHLRREAAEAVRQARRIPDGQVRLGRRAEVVERLQEPEARLRHERPAVVAHAGNRLGHPGGIAGEEIVVLRRAQEADDAQLDDEVVDDLLRLLLGQRAGRQIPFEVDVEERRRAPERHRRAVLFFDAGEVAEIQPLDRLARVAPPGARRRSRSSPPSAAVP